MTLIYAGLALQVADFMYFLAARHVYLLGYWLTALAGSVLTLAGYTLEHDWISCPVQAAGAVLFAYEAWKEWRKRRKDRRHRAALGGKAALLIAQMAARLREKPARPALRPVPQGAA